MYTRYFLPLTLLVAVSAACGGDKVREGDATNATDSAVESTAPRTTDSGVRGANDSTAADSARVIDSIVAAIRACPRDGKWHACSLERRLQMSGFRTVREDSVVRIPGVAQEAALWLIGRQPLRVVFFESAEEAERAMGLLDSARAAPRGDTAVVWADRPTLMRSENALVVLLGGSERTIERISNAVTAGPPQPERQTP